MISNTRASDSGSRGSGGARLGPLRQAILKAATGVAVLAAAGIWGVVQVAMGRRPLSWLGPEAAYFVYRLLKGPPGGIQDAPSPDNVPPSPDRAEASSPRSPRPGAAVPEAGEPKVRPEKPVGESPDRSKEALARAGEQLRKPATGAAMVGAAVVGIAALVGVAETAVGAAAAYGIYRALAKRRAADGTRPAR
jgi:hypothetical protein